MGDPQVHDRLQVLGQSCDPFIFGGVLTGCVALPGRPKNRQHAFARHRVIAAAANEELVGCIWQVDRHVCIQILHRRCQCGSQPRKYVKSRFTFRGSRSGSVSAYPKASALARSVEINCARWDAIVSKCGARHIIQPRKTCMFLRDIAPQSFALKSRVSKTRCS